MDTSGNTKMSIEQKAKAYDEALERARELRDKALAYNANHYVKDYETIFPALKESEDERMMRVIGLALTDVPEGRFTSLGTTLKDCLAYLEKQKENPKSADSISSDCTSSAKCEDRWHKVTDSLPDNGREVLAKDKLGNTLLARYDGDGWDVSVYDDEDYRCHNGISKWCEIPSEKQKDHFRDDTKMIELQDYYGLNDLERAIHRGFLAAGVENVPVTIIKETAKECLEQMKPAEWSEEDEAMIKSILFVLESYVSHSESASSPSLITTYPTYYKEIDWLKSLRPQPQHRNTYYDIIHNILGSLKGIDFTQITPEHRVSLLNDIRVKCKNADECAAILDEPHWKPSKEQIEALKLSFEEAFDDAGDCNRYRRLKSLYEQLKKLM